MVSTSSGVDHQEEVEEAEVDLSSFSASSSFSTSEFLDFSDSETEFTDFGSSPSLSGSASSSSSSISIGEMVDEGALTHRLGEEADDHEWNEGNDEGIMDESSLTRPTALEEGNRKCSRKDSSGAEETSSSSTEGQEKQKDKRKKKKKMRGKKKKQKEKKRITFNEEQEIMKSFPEQERRFASEITALELEKQFQASQERIMRGNKSGRGEEEEEEDKRDNGKEKNDDGDGDEDEGEAATSDSSSVSSSDSEEFMDSGGNPAEIIHNVEGALRVRRKLPDGTDHWENGFFVLNRQVCFCFAFC